MRFLCGLILIGGCSIDQEKANQASDMLPDVMTNDALLPDALVQDALTEDVVADGEPEPIYGDPICTQVARHSSPPGCPVELLARLRLTPTEAVPAACPPPMLPTVKIDFPNGLGEHQSDYCLSLAGLPLQSFTTEQTAPSCNVSAIAVRTIVLGGTQLEETYAFRFDLLQPLEFNQLIYTLEDHPECSFEVSFEYENLD